MVNFVEQCCEVISKPIIIIMDLLNANSMEAMLKGLFSQEGLQIKLL